MVRPDFPLDKSLKKIYLPVGKYRLEKSDEDTLEAS
jgi:hypothetical protein